MSSRSEFEKKNKKTHLINDEQRRVTARPFPCMNISIDEDGRLVRVSDGETDLEILLVLSSCFQLDNQL